jgi:hypothetical protein
MEVHALYGDFLLDKVPSAALDEPILRRVHGAFIAAAQGGNAYITIQRSQESVTDRFPTPCLEWGSDVDYSMLVIVPCGVYEVTEVSVIINAITNFDAGFSLPVRRMPTRRLHRKFFVRGQAPVAQLPHQAWERTVETIERVFRERVSVIIDRKQPITTVTVMDPRRETRIVSFAYGPEGREWQEGVCLSGAERTLNPLAVIASYFELQQSHSLTLAGAIQIQP